MNRWSAFYRKCALSRATRIIPSWTVANVLAIAFVSYSSDPSSVSIVVNTEAKEAVTHSRRRQMTIENPVASRVPEDCFELLFQDCIVFWVSH